MNTTARFGLAILGFMLLAPASAQDTNDDEATAWLTVSQQWSANQKGDDDWVDEMLADDFMGWGVDSPAPRSKGSTRSWTRFNAQLGQMVQHELYPLSVIVHGDVAIAHYLYTSAYKNKDGEIEINNGRYTDVLVRTEDGWQFIAWHGGNDDE
jgi:ketosteroid isomerase-like protein